MLTGVVYEIRNTKTNDNYIGSTYMPLKMRYAFHLSESQRNNQMRVCQMIKNSNLKDIVCEPLYEGQFASKTELRELEGVFQNRLNPTLNKNRAGYYTKIGHKEYMRQYLKGYNQKYYDEHKDYFRDYYKNHRITRDVVKNVLIER